MDQQLPRKLAAILYADVAGYSRLTGLDEAGTHNQLSACLDLMADRIRNAEPADADHDAVRRAYGLKAAASVGGPAYADTIGDGRGIW